MIDFSVYSDEELKQLQGHVAVEMNRRKENALNTAQNAVVDALKAYFELGGWIGAHECEAWKIDQLDTCDSYKIVFE